MQDVDGYRVPDVNWRDVRQYLALEHFKTEVRGIECCAITVRRKNTGSQVIATKNSAAAGLCSWVINIVMYRDIVVTVEPKRQVRCCGGTG